LKCENKAEGELLPENKGKVWTDEKNGYLRCASSPFGLERLFLQTKERRLSEPNGSH